MLERYDEQAALEAHRAALHFKELARRPGEYLPARPEAQVVPEV